MSEHLRGGYGTPEVGIRVKGVGVNMQVSSSSVSSGPKIQTCSPVVVHPTHVRISSRRAPKASTNRICIRQSLFRMKYTRDVVPRSAPFQVNRQPRCKRFYRHERLETAKRQVSNELPYRNRLSYISIKNRTGID